LAAWFSLLTALQASCASGIERFAGLAGEDISLGEHASSNIFLCPAFFWFNATFLGISPFIVTMAAKAQKNLLMRRVDLADDEAQQDILIRQACSDRAAFARLYRMHYERVFRYCSRRLFNRHTAEDVTSTVFFKVMRAIGSFEGDSNDFRNWLYRIATNAVNDHLRTGRKRAEAIKAIAQGRSSDLARATGPDHERLGDDLSVKQALLCLKPKYQTVITLHFFERLKLIEIAEILGKNPATIRSQLSRALSKLRNKLQAVEA
jgi:RNA polymerase sigma-70 factor (ECF subfamily)